MVICNTFNVHIAEHLQHKHRFDYVATDYIFDQFVTSKNGKFAVSTFYNCNLFLRIK